MATKTLKKTTAEQTPDIEVTVDAMTPEKAEVISDTSEEKSAAEATEENKEDVKVEVDATANDFRNIPKANVKIKTNRDYSCVIAMVRYDLVAGKVYNVPRNVKNILNRAGVLAPL